jgi:hypothetical protein
MYSSEKTAETVKTEGREEELSVPDIERKPV